MPEIMCVFYEFSLILDEEEHPDEVKKLEESCYCNSSKTDISQIIHFLKSGQTVHIMPTKSLPSIRKRLIRSIIIIFSHVEQIGLKCDF